MSPVARPPQLPPLPSHPTLRARVETIERMCAQLEMARQESADLAINIATATRTFATQGLMELNTLPSTVRRAYENLIYVSAVMMRNEPPESRVQALTAMYVTARVIAEAYELEGTGDAVPPPLAPDTNSLDSGQPPS